ncbi:glycine-rich cell wall structural protein 1.8-like [Arachis ipaensis]|uniref:glycine-rich cell wall structural protein 1.8-like n=1 Tax=Arachis ipaensis TaxID=130454 RepID=UPI0007AF879A|nr:glycine-rich cell wall structural protein 1.8-like [Arachis ipaensis]XP_025665039.1 glycine-rich cell wall structural protein 1.8-like [Arachis hypogaea]
MAKEASATTHGASSSTILPSSCTSLSLSLCGDLLMDWWQRDAARRRLFPSRKLSPSARRCGDLAARRCVVCKEKGWQVVKRRCLCNKGVKVSVSGRQGGRGRNHRRSRSGGQGSAWHRRRGGEDEGSDDDDSGQGGGGYGGGRYDSGDRGGCGGVYGGHNGEGDGGQGRSSGGGGGGHAGGGDGQAAGGEAGGQSQVYGCGGVSGEAKVGGDMVG